MAPHSSTLAWKIPWTEEPGRLQSMGSLRVRHDWVTSLSLSCIGEGNGNSLQCSCLENPRDGGAWWAAIYGVSQSRTWLKQLSSSSSSIKIEMVPYSLPWVKFWGCHLPFAVPGENGPQFCSFFVFLWQEQSNHCLNVFCLAGLPLCYFFG